MRYTGWRKLSGDLDSPESIDLGKQLLGFLDEQRRLGKATTMEIERLAPNGDLVRARFVGNLPQVEIQSTKGKGQVQEEIVYAYLSSDAGLRIFDLVRKEQVKLLTGLQTYDVDGVSKDGKTLWMSGNTIAVRVDLGTSAAFGYSYLFNSVPPSGTSRAGVVGAILSPDETRVLLPVDFAYEPGAGGTVSIIDALSGYIVANATTLAPMRSGIHMGFRPVMGCWATNSQHFFVPTSLNTDPGDVADPGVADSLNDYISKFTRDGVLVASTLLASWGFAPGAGFQRRIKSIAVSPDGKRLYAMVNSTQAGPYGGAFVIYALDLEDAAMPVVGQLVFGISSDDRSRQMLVNRAGTVLNVLFDNQTIGVVKLPELALTSRTADTFFTNAVPSAYSHYYAPMIQNGPEGAKDGRLATRQFILNVGSDTLRAYGGFGEAKTYEFDMSVFAVHARYALAYGGLRPARTKQ